MTTGPKNVKEPVSKWGEGPQELVDYLQNVYIPLYKNFSNHDFNRRLIYQKRQFAGMPAQMMGVCEVLFIGMSHRRLVYSFFFVSS